MKDLDHQAIFDRYYNHRTSEEPVTTGNTFLTEQAAVDSLLREDFPFTGAEDTDDDKDTSSDDSSDKKEETKSDDGESKSAPSPKPKPESKPEDGKLSEEELDEELEVLAAKKDKIQKLFDSDSIDKDVAKAALDKLKSLTNELVGKYI